MLKKFAMLLGSLLFALPVAAAAQSTTSIVPTAGSSGKVSFESLVQRYSALAGSQANAESLVNGLRTGAEVTLTATVTTVVKQWCYAPPTTVTVTDYLKNPFTGQTFLDPFTGQPIVTGTHQETQYDTTGYDCSSTDVQTVTTTFTSPTGNMGWGNVDIALALTEAVLMQGNIAAHTIFQLQTALMNTDNGVLQLRAKKMGWGDIAKAFGLKLA